VIEIGLWWWGGWGGDGGNWGVGFQGGIGGQMLGCGNGVVQLCAVVATFEFACVNMSKNVCV